METRVLLPTDENIEYVAKLLNNGEICGIPTETVYGLAANAMDSNAVSKIFAAKGRPQDNPLIIHINSLEMLKPLVSEISDIALALAEKFWPGPLTMIFPKSDAVSLEVTAGLSTVAVRFPSHKVALNLIATAGVPLAAPSANLSGSPSPTTATHVFSDMNTKIPAILDGGACEVGLESTVIALHNNYISLLRPGGVTVEMLKSVVSRVEIDSGVLNSVAEETVVSSPGMKHTHYSPSTKLFVVDSTLEQFVAFLENQTDKNIGVMIFDGEDKFINVPYVTFGKEDDSIIQAKLLFSSLRAIDDLNVDTVYARMPDKTGVGLGVYNRLIRACGFEIITL